MSSKAEAKAAKAEAKAEAKAAKKAGGVAGSGDGRPPKGKLRKGVPEGSPALGRGKLVQSGDSVEAELFPEESEALAALRPRLPEVIATALAEAWTEAEALRASTANEADLPWWVTVLPPKGEVVPPEDVFTDRFLVNSLMTRKSDVDRTVVLLGNNLKYRLRAKPGKAYAFPDGADMAVLCSSATKDDGSVVVPEGVTMATRTESLLLLRGMPMLSDVAPYLGGVDFFWSVPGARGKNGEVVIYGDIDGWNPAAYDHAEAVDWVMAVMCFLGEMERVDASRHGFLIFVNAENLGWKNFDQALEQRMSEVYQDNFPLRWSKFVMLKAPIIVRAMMQIMKVFLTKKMASRMQSSTQSVEKIQEFVDADDVPKSMGGNLDYSHADFIRDAFRWEQEHSPIYKAKKGANRSAGAGASEDSGAASASATADDE